MTSSGLSAPIDASEAHPARRYDYWLGGKDNFAADRESGDAIEKIYPHIRTSARQNRMFLRRVVRYLVEEAGIRQFLDVGTGLPAAGNTHQVAQGIAPQCRIVYVDNDPLVMVHARALLTGCAEGRTAYIEADLREPQAILADETLTGTLDLAQPIAVLLVAVLHFLPDDSAAGAAVKILVDAMAPGSYLVVSHATDGLMDHGIIETLSDGGHVGKTDTTLRSKAGVAAFFDGLTMVDPGLQIVSEWRPETDRPPTEQVSVYGGAAYK
ncbi:SAM-dependent methyltransferase [Actinoplanes sp. NPDC026619]|uniref:SAM-dependent methyltransferase n=1 Tax=Actinoplanes sp. NPDC026619 TaxID=3155798 RepID=UPI0033D1AD38